MKHAVSNCMARTFFSSLRVTPFKASSVIDTIGSVKPNASVVHNSIWTVMGSTLPMVPAGIAYTQQGRLGCRRDGRGPARWRASAAGAAHRRPGDTRQPAGARPPYGAGNENTAIADRRCCHGGSRPPGAAWRTQSEPCSSTRACHQDSPQTSSPSPSARGIGSVRPGQCFLLPRDSPSH